MKGSEESPPTEILPLHFVQGQNDSKDLAEVWVDLFRLP